MFNVYDSDCIALKEYTSFFTHSTLICYECTEPFSQHIRTAQTVLANKYAEHWCSLPESKEMVGEAEAPMTSRLSVGQLMSRVSSRVHLPMLFQLSPGAVSDMWCGALATDDDTVACIEIFTDGSSCAICLVWRPLVDGEFSVLQFVTINALPLVECSLGKSQ